MKFGRKRKQIVHDITIYDNTLVSMNVYQSTTRGLMNENARFSIQRVSGVTIETTAYGTVRTYTEPRWRIVRRNN